MNEVYALSKSQIVVSFTETEKKKNAWMGETMSLAWVWGAVLPFGWG
jgi:hypothetical protein